VCVCVDVGDAFIMNGVVHAHACTCVVRTPRCVVAVDPDDYDGVEGVQGDTDAHNHTHSHKQQREHSNSHAQDTEMNMESGMCESQHTLPHSQNTSSTASSSQQHSSLHAAHTYAHTAPSSVCGVQSAFSPQDQEYFRITHRCVCVCVCV
jgi:hypothetical protein